MKPLNSDKSKEHVCDHKWKTRTYIFKSWEAEIDVILFKNTFQFTEMSIKSETTCIRRMAASRKQSLPHTAKQNSEEKSPWVLYYDTFPIHFLSKPKSTNETREPEW